MAKTALRRGTQDEGDSEYLKGTDYQLPIDGNGGSETRPKNANVYFVIRVL